MPIVRDLSFYLPSKQLKFLGSKQVGGKTIWMTETKPTRNELCPRCGECCSVFYGKVKSRVRDEPLRSETLVIEILKQRYYCKSCRKPFTENVEGLRKYQRSTGRFKKFIALMCEKFSNIQDVQKTYHTSSSFTYKVFYEHQATKIGEKINYSWPEVIGIDEHFFTRKRGYAEYATVLTDMNHERLYEMVEGKDVKGLIAQLRDLPGRENVKKVVMDMSSTYRRFVREFFPNAEIIADKFHVLRLLTPAIMKHHSQIVGAKKELRMKKLLLKNRHELDYFLRSEIDQYLKQYPELNQLYRFKERLYEFYRTKGVVRAVRGFYRLVEDLLKQESKELKRLGKTLRIWKREILIYFATGLTNARTEAFNKTAKLVQRRACGYKSFKNYRLRTLNACS